MKVKKLSMDDINFVVKCCNNRMFDCDECPYRFSKRHSSSYNNYDCVCDLNYVRLDDFDNIEDFVNLMTELGEEEVRDIDD